MKLQKISILLFTSIVKASNQNSSRNGESNAKDSKAQIDIASYKRLVRITKMILISPYSLTKLQRRQTDGMNRNQRIQINLRMMRNMLSLIIVQQTLAAQMRRATIRSHSIAWERSILPPILKIEANITPLQIVVRENTTIQTKLALN